MNEIALTLPLITLTFSLTIVTFLYLTSSFSDSLSSDVFKV